LVRRILEPLVAAKPDAVFVLGGPQVINQAAKYVAPGRENLLVCNGEGERIFANVLRTTLSPDRDFSTVPGLSFRRDGELVTTEPEPRISDLNEVPSPFLEGLFEPHKYTFMLLETNRGCPFKCSYCFWGAATGARVFRYDDQRVERELEWISQSGCVYLFIADANWGMLKRDLDLSKFLVECKRKHGGPMSVYFCASKNTPDRVSEIAQLFHEGGLVSGQAVSLQTMSEETLRRVERDNIKTSAYTKIQHVLNDNGISSFVELIWPLPGETLASFQEGLAQLCALGADCFSVFPLLLMNNVALYEKVAEYGMVTIRDPDPNSEAEVVVQTTDVSAATYQDGWRYVYAVNALHSLRGLWCLGRYLHTSGTLPYAELFRRFVAFGRARPDHVWTRFFEESIRSMKNVQFSNTGALVHLLLHAERAVFDALLEEFVTAQEFWSDPTAQFFFEIDLINRPYVYSNTKVLPKQHRFAQLRVTAVRPDGYVLEVPAGYADALAEYLAIHSPTPGTHTIEVTHRQVGLPYMPSKSLHEHYMYCQSMFERMRKLAPRWTLVAPSASVMPSVAMTA
jgi:putative methyltransferase